MAKKQQNDPNKLLITAIKKTVNTNSVLPILEDVYFNGRQAIVTDLETSVIIPHEKPGLDVCVPAKKVVQIMEMMPDAEITPLPPKEEPMVPQYGATFTHGKRVVKVIGDKSENFPVIYMNDDGQYPKIGSLKESDMKLIETAICFVSKDSLRPSMTGINFEKEIQATDAHRLFFHDLSDPVTVPFIMPAKTAKILLALGGEWEITNHEEGKTRYVCLTRADGVKVVTRPIDSRFPDVNVVIPKEKGLVKLTANPSALLTELKNAGSFANKQTNLIVLGMNGVFSVSSQDIDLGEEYRSEHPNSNTGDFTFGFHKTVEKSLFIAFNQKLLSEIVSKLGDQPVEMQFWSPNKCTIINDHFLLMPLLQLQ